MVSAKPTTGRVTVLPQDNYLRTLMTILRNSETDCTKFADVVERVSTLVMAAALNLLPTEALNVKTPTGATFPGAVASTEVCGVSILRAGASMENALRRTHTGPLCYGKILIQRDESTSLPTHLYSKFPQNVTRKAVFILEPMLATGGSACMAVDIIKAAGVPENQIFFINLVASRKGLDTLSSRFPELRIVTAAVDENLTASNHISPGLGDFGDRFYGTVD
ncbi:uracil phosphoribosyltransferase-domain-containing protein [Dactylonectria estremocensis]|uniref:uracil phosphoribosyltransferase n=1 Tax=Dactylonectria estremocensis TaxID=1079267 RepID=A0A9P9DZF7_9HYPO|nr:uracil phosphoribosyltransferase-domain-containing protein [Dactylonectria estremocensis]